MHGTTDPPHAQPPDLLSLALSRPNDALVLAREVLARDPGPLEASVARQAIGIVLREVGDVDAAIRELRRARRLARRSGSADREADVLATLGLALVFAGRTAAGRAALEAAVERSSGLLRGRVLLRRGGALHVLGDHRNALADLSNAITSLRLADDQVWEARALTARVHPPGVRFAATGRGGPTACRAVVHRERAGAGVGGRRGSPRRARLAQR